jgi:hypothetical protein
MACLISATFCELKAGSDPLTDCMATDTTVAGCPAEGLGAAGRVAAGLGPAAREPAGLGPEPMVLVELSIFMAGGFRRICSVC